MNNIHIRDGFYHEWLLLQLFYFTMMFFGIFIITDSYAQDLASVSFLFPRLSLKAERILFFPDLPKAVKYPSYHLRRPSLETCGSLHRWRYQNASSM